MNYSFSSIRAIVLLLFFALITGAGCRENTIINSKVAPSNNSDSVYTYTLPTIITHTYNTDSTVTSTNIGGIPIFQGVGAVSDPYFGSIIGSTYFQIIPTTVSNLYDPVGDSTAVDSAVLFMPYGSLTYGDTANTSTSQSYQVFYMQDSIGLNTTYYNYNTKAIDLSNPLSDPTPVNIYSIKDTLSVNGLYYFKGMRIKLKLPALMGKLINALNYASSVSAGVDPNAAFISAFNGICVRPANTNVFAAALPYFQLDGSDQYSEANVTVYYHSTKYGVADTLSQVYYFNSGICAHFNSITRSYSHAPVNALFNSKNANDNIIALQNLPGASLDVIVPGIKSIPAGAVINKVELQLTLLPNYNDTIFYAPEKLSPLGVGSVTYPIGVGAGLEYNIADRYPLTSLSPLGVMDGYKHAYPPAPAAPQYQRFTLDFPREVMASIQANNDTMHLHIYGTQDYYGAFHLVVGGGSYPDPNYRAKVIVVYSKLKKQP